MDTKSYNQCLNEMKNDVISKQSKITDFNEGSVITSFIEAVARQVALVYIRARVGFDYYLRGLPYSIFSFSKKTGVKASGTVVFSRTKALSFDSIIPIGTMLKSGQLRFLTSETGKILANSLVSGNVKIKADKTGAKYNVSENTVTTIESVLSSDIVSVSNSEKIVGGRDEESEASRDLRFQDYIKGLQGTNKYGLKSALLSLASIRSISITEHFPPIDDIYNATIYIDDGTGNAPQAVQDEAFNIIDGDGTASNPGRRAAGINIRTMAPVIVPIDIDLKIKTYRVESALAVSETEDKIKDFINNLLIGENLTLTTLILLLRRTAYIKDVEIIAPITNITIADNQIARFSSINIVVEAL